MGECIAFLPKLRFEKCVQTRYDSSIRKAEKSGACSNMKISGKQTPRAFLPVIVILVLAFIFYTIIDSAILYRHISSLAMIGAGIVLGLIAFAIFRFTLTYYEYLIVGDELIIRRRSPLRVTKISTYRFQDIESIGKLRRFSHMSHVKMFNRCNSIWATLFAGTVMLYHDRNTLEDERIVIEPPANIRRVLQLNLQDRYDPS